MSYLGDWLKEIIIIVLFAVFIDLLLPNRAMERYVKFVVSLLILLTLISPVMRIFSGSEPEKLVSAALAQMGGEGEGGTAAETAMILKEGELLRRSREAEAIQYAGDQAAIQMKQQIELETGMPVERVSVTLTRVTADAANHDGENNGSAAGEGMLQVDRVEVVMKEAGTGSTSTMKQNNREIRIDKVERVAVRMEDRNVRRTEDGLQEPQDSQPAVSAVSEQSSLDPQLTDRITSLLQRDWGVDPQAVQVVTTGSDIEER